MTKTKTEDPVSEHEYSSSFDLKELTELIRALNPHIASVQRGISRVVTPFFVLTIMYFLTIYDTNLPTFVAIDKFSYGGHMNSENVWVDAITFENIRSVTLFLMSLGLFYIFVRFGYLYYQGNKLIANLQSIIGGDINHGNALEISRVVHHVCKENYLIQALVVLRKDVGVTGLEGTKASVTLAKSLSVVMMVIFIFFMGFAQYMTAFYLANTAWFFAIVVCSLYFAYYLMFVLNIIFDGYRKEDKSNRKYDVPFAISFSVLCVANVGFIAIGFVQGVELRPQLVSKSPIPLSNMVFPYGYIFSSLEN